MQISLQGRGHSWNLHCRDSWPLLSFLSSDACLRTLVDVFFYFNVRPFGDHCSQENINQLECEIFKDSQSFVGPVIWIYEMYVLILWGIGFNTYSSPVHPLLDLIHLAPTTISTSSPAQILPAAWLMNSSAGLTLGLMMFKTVESDTKMHMEIKFFLC